MYPPVALLSVLAINLVPIFVYNMRLCPTFISVLSLFLWDDFPSLRAALVEIVLPCLSG